MLQILSSKCHVINYISRLFKGARFASVILRGKSLSFLPDPQRTSAHWLIFKIIMLCNSCIAHQGNFQVKVTTHEYFFRVCPSLKNKNFSFLNNNPSSICQEIPPFSGGSVSFTSTANFSYRSDNVFIVKFFTVLQFMYECR